MLRDKISIFVSHVLCIQFTNSTNKVEPFTVLIFSVLFVCEGMGVREGVCGCVCASNSI